MTDRFKFRFWRKDYDGKSTPEYADLMSIDGSAEPYDNSEGGAYCYYPDETICEQCTGLKDKNGKLIYEGDILAVPYIDPIFMQPFNMEVNNDVAYVESYKGCFVAHYPEKQRKYLYDYENIAEVIGNIHENEELLK